MRRQLGARRAPSNLPASSAELSQCLCVMLRTGCTIPCLAAMSCMYHTLLAALACKQAPRARMPSFPPPRGDARCGGQISDGIAGMADGRVAAIGVALGALLPVIPVFISASIFKCENTPPLLVLPGEIRRR